VWAARTWICGASRSIRWSRWWTRRASTPVSLRTGPPWPRSVCTAWRGRTFRSTSAASAACSTGWGAPSAPSCATTPSPCCERARSAGGGGALSGDAVARNILNEQAGEVALMATATIRRLRLSSTDVDVILGGGMFQADDPEFLRRVENEILRVAPSARIAILRVPPIVGAALLGLDELGAPASASSRVREEIDHATIDHTIGRRSATDRSSRGL